MLLSTFCGRSARRPLANFQEPDGDDKDFDGSQLDRVDSCERI